MFYPNGLCPIRQHPLFCALAAIVLWASLATLGASVAALPPFFTVGVSLMVRQPVRHSPLATMARAAATLLLGVVGCLATISFCLSPFVWPRRSDQSAELPVAAADRAARRLLLPGYHLNTRHILGALAGFVGAALVDTGVAQPLPARHGCARVAALL